MGLGARIGEERPASLIRATETPGRAGSFPIVFRTAHSRRCGIVIVVVIV
jgi:hypothetical protein